MARRSVIIFVLCAVLLTALGFIMQMSTGGFTNDTASDEWSTVRRQGWALLIGIFCCGVFALFDYRHFRKLAIPIYVASVTLLLLCFVPFVQHVINSSARWISIGPLTFQPSEVARIGSILTLAAYGAHFRDERTSFLKGFIIPFVIMLPPIGLIAGEVDLGAAILLSIASGVVIYASGARFIYLVCMAMVAAMAFGLFVWNIPNRKARVVAFLHIDDPKWAQQSKKNKDIAELNAQQNKGLIALGSGGILGAGLGDGRQKQYRLELPNTDFIFPVIGEELGVIGTLTTVFLFLCLALTGLNIASDAPDRFGKLLGIGLVSLIIFQALINIAVTTGCLPNKGMPLPFVSYGGSNLVCMLASVGVLLNIHRQGRPLRTASDPVLGRPKLTPAV